MTATSQAKQIEVQIASAVRTLRADATFMSTVPPIQGIIAARQSPDASPGRPDEVKVFCAELERVGSENERITGKRLIAAAAVHDHASGEIFGMVLLELDLRSTVGSLLVPERGDVGEAYVTDREGVVLLSSEPHFINHSSAADPNILSLVPKAAEFLTVRDQEKTVTDERSFVALKIFLEPNDPTSAIHVVIAFAT